MNFIADIGNTGIKCATARGAELHAVKRYQTVREMADSLLLAGTRFDGIIVSSVIAVESSIVETLKGLCSLFLMTSHTTPLPFSSRYLTPETLGGDRIAAMAAAHNKHGERAVLVIDAGTAITFDIIEGGVHKGGTISPGIDIRFRALNSFTGSLPLASKEEALTPELPLTTLTTLDAIKRGVLNGAIFEINEYIRRFNKCHPDGLVIITGGDSKLLSEATDQKCITEPDLVLLGLNHILNYNADKSS